MSWRRLGRRLEDVLKTSWRRFRKTYCKHVWKTSSWRLAEVFVRRLANTSWRRLEEIFKTSWKKSSRCLGDVLEKKKCLFGYFQDVFAINVFFVVECSSCCYKYLLTQSFCCAYYLMKSLFSLTVLYFSMTKKRFIYIITAVK